MENNIVTAVFNGSKSAVTDSLWQYDYGQILKIKGIDLPELYEVHVSGSASGNVVTVFGNADGVAIPDDYLLKSGSITMYIYLHTGENDGETEYKITIPVKGRAKPNHETPTPVQQSEIERLIALCEEIIEHGGGGGGSDGFSPVVTVTEITGGYQLSIQDKTHTETFNIMNGQDGQNGKDGINGINGKDGVDGKDGKDGKDGINGTDGKDGSDGVSPTISVTEITGGHTVTITDAEHPNGISFNVMDGIDGQDGADGQNGSDGQDGSDYVLTAQDKSDIAQLVNVSTPRIAKTSSDTTAELEPNKFYVFPEMSALTITLASPTDANIVNEYHFIFTSGATATTLTIPQTVNEPSGFTVEASKVYEVSIVDNYMLAVSWSVGA